MDSYEYGEGYGAWSGGRLFLSNPQNTQKGIGEVTAFTDWETRRARYEFFWSLYQNNSYGDGTASWHNVIKVAFGLPKFTRNIFAPVYKLTEFWTSHIFGGDLDPAAGDGQLVPSAIPIVTDDERLRPVIAQIWRDSKWQSRKSIFTRSGSLFGDVFLKVVDDPVRRMVWIDVVHPGHVKWAQFDPRDGSITDYIFETQRFIPNMPSLLDWNPAINPKSLFVQAIYNELATTQGGSLVYKTFQNYSDYNWRGATGDGSELPATWAPPYDFVPLVQAQHININMNWGIGEPHCMVAKIFEVDGAGSTLSDSLRRQLNGPWLLTGMGMPGGRTGVRQGVPVASTTPVPTLGDPQIGKDDIANIYGPAGATATPLTFDLNMEGGNAFIAALKKDLRENWPELGGDDWSTGDTSGRAIRISREAIETKVLQRRPAYQEALVKAHMMAIKIGVIQGYPGFEAFSLADLENGSIEHTIGKSPIFSNDVADDLDLQAQFWMVAKAAVDAGTPLTFWLKEQGWTDERITAMLNARTRESLYPTATGEVRTQTRDTRTQQVQGGKSPSDAVASDAAPNPAGING